MKNGERHNHSEPSVKAYCIFCGSTLGQISERTSERVNAVYDCPRCQMNYCDQCSYEKEVNGRVVQVCLRCGSQMEQVMPAIHSDFQ